MIEEDWLACEDPEKMLRFLGRRSIQRNLRIRLAERKLRLFSVACCRRLWPLFVNDQSRYCVEVAERFADNQATTEELRVAEAEADSIWMKNAGNDTAWACRQVCKKEVGGMYVSMATIRAAFVQQQSEANKLFDPLDGRRSGACSPEEWEQCRLLRDIFGNPFRPIALGPSWRTSTVTALAQQMYDSRDFSAMPILADALQDAGCDNEVIFDHCRRPRVHVRGCWLVDLCLGRCDFGGKVERQ